MITSGHFEWASTMMKNIFPWNGPAKSSLPGGVRPYPWMQRGSWGRGLQDLTYRTELCEGFDVSVQPTPPKIALSDSLHSGDFRVALMEGLQHPCL